MFEFGSVFIVLRSHRSEAAFEFVFVFIMQRSHRSKAVFEFVGAPLSPTHSMCM